MRTLDFIIRKRNGNALTAKEIDFLVQGYTQGQIPDYQMSALLMAIYFRGMTSDEMRHLILSMINSGSVVDLSSISGIKVDKHSTGGVGDKVSLILAPLVASTGTIVPMISGRGLGHSGGTLDKLESIPGFCTQLPLSRYIELVKKIGIVMIGQTADLAPADLKMYALRDVTATIESVPLIASSILSKKLAAGPDAIVFDVKTGKAAFMKSLAESIELAQTLVKVSSEMGRKSVALITDMNQPLGNKIGNALEVEESIAALSGNGPPDLMTIVYALGAYMLMLAEKTTSFEDAILLLKEKLGSGAALEKLREMIVAQGGDPSVIDNPRKLPQAPITLEVRTPQPGWIKEIDALKIGKIACELGAGRSTIADTIDPAVGLCLHKKIGDYVTKDELLVTVYSNHEENAKTAALHLINLFEFSEIEIEPKPLIYKIVTENENESFVKEINID